MADLRLAQKKDKISLEYKDVLKKWMGHVKKI